MSEAIVNTKDVVVEDVSVTVIESVVQEPVVIGSVVQEPVVQESVVTESVITEPLISESLAEVLEPSGSIHNESDPFVQENKINETVKPMAPSFFQRFFKCGSKP